MSVRGISAAVFIVAFLSSSFVEGGQPVAKMQIQELRLGAVPADRLHERVTFRGGHIAWVLRHDAKSVVVVDGREGPQYDEILVPPPQEIPADLKPLLGKSPSQVDEELIHWLNWSPDDRRLAYVARRGDKWFAVVDGEEGSPFEKVDLPEFTKDSRHFLYRANRGGKSVPVLDGKAGGEYDGWADGPWFSEAGGRVACAAIRDGKQIPLVDGEEGNPHDEVRRIVFSKDGEHVGCIVVDGNEYSVVADGKPGPAYDWIGGLEFSPDGKHIAYHAQTDGKPLVVVDKCESPRYDRILARRPAFDAQGTVDFLAIRDMTLYRVVISSQ